MAGPNRLLTPYPNVLETVDITERKRPTIKDERSPLLPQAGSLSGFTELRMKFPNNITIPFSFEHEIDCGLINSYLGAPGLPNPRGISV